MVVCALSIYMDRLREILGDEDTVDSTNSKSTWGRMVIALLVFDQGNSFRSHSPPMCLTTLSICFNISVLPRYGHMTTNPMGRKSSAYFIINSADSNWHISAKPR